MASVEAATRAERIAVFEAQLDEARRRKHRDTAIGVALVVAATLVSSWVGEVDLAKLAAGLPNVGAYIWGTVPTVRASQPLEDLSEWMWGLDLWLVLLADTVLMGFIATVFGGASAFAASFLAATNTAPSRLVFHLARRLLEFARTVPELVYALIFVYAFGLGPLAGVLAIAIHTLGALGKLFAEVNENADRRGPESIRAAGGSWAQAIRFGIVPQVLPNHASHLLLRFEINVRSASVIGVVGAGGIGEELYLAVRQFQYPDISAIVLLILLTVSLIDLACARLRGALIGNEHLRAAA